MVFSLTEEQIKIIKENYCDDVDVINNIQDDLNDFEIVKDADDFFELVCSTALTFESLKQDAIRKIKQEQIVIGDLNSFVEYITPIRSILENEIIIKYGDDYKKSKTYNKKRHF